MKKELVSKTTEAILEEYKAIESQHDKMIGALEKNTFKANQTYNAIFKKQNDVVKFMFIMIVMLTLAMIIIVVMQFSLFFNS